MSETSHDDVSTCKRPVDVAAGEQLAFIESVLEKPPARILDGGCGRGDLASRLLEIGFDVVGVDSNPDNVKEARSRAVPAVHADFVTYEDDPFDVVLFSRSLHHMQPLSEAVARAYSLLRPGGLLVGDEFSVDWMDQETATWFYDTMTLLQEAGVLTPSDRVPPPGAPLERWHRHHHEDPPMSGGDAMVRAVKDQFGNPSISQGPFLYWHLGGWLEDSERGCRLARAMLDIERRRISEGSLAATGLRIVARRPA